MSELPWFLQDQRIITSLKDEISKLEKILAELRLSADTALKENEILKEELGRAQVHAGAAVKLTETESNPWFSDFFFPNMYTVNRDRKKSLDFRFDVPLHVYS